MEVSTIPEKPKITLRLSRESYALLLREAELKGLLSVQELIRQKLGLKLVD